MELPATLTKRIEDTCHVSVVNVTQALVPAAKGNQSGCCQEERTGVGVSPYQTVGRPGERSPREKIITKELARNYRIGNEYEGHLIKADAQRVLDLLIAQDAGTYTPHDTAATFGQIAREYLATVEPGWGPYTVRTSKGLIEHALIGGKLGSRPVVKLPDRAATIPSMPSASRSC